MVLCWGSVSEKTIRKSAQSLMNSKFKTKQNVFYVNNISMYVTFKTVMLMLLFL